MNLRNYEVPYKIPTAPSTPAQKAVVQASDKAAALKVFAASYRGARISGSLRELPSNERGSARR